MLRLEPQNEAAQAGIASLSRDARESRQMAQANTALKNGDTASALRSFNAILAENPAQVEAKKASEGIEIERNRGLTAEPLVSEALKKPVTLELRDVAIQTILEIFSQTSGVNFVLDKDLKSDLKTTIFAKNTSVEDALNLVLRTSQLNKKVLNESTLLIYADTEEKRKRYEELVMRTFYLKNADPKKMQEMVKTLIAPKSMYVDDRFKMMIVRDNLNVIAAVERLVAAYDVADAEVLLEVEILEVNSSSLLNAGIQYPSSISASVFGVAGVAGRLTPDELTSLNRSNFKLFLPDPLLVLNLKETNSDAKTLANPRIRVTNRQKAKVLIGDKVPVITTTVNQTSSASTESISYLDVGLKLEVVPEIHVNGEVTIAIDLEVSNVVKEIRSTTGLLAYQIGTRNANTTLRLRDGETQVLAGLIKDEQNNNSAGIPVLGTVPVAGRLFSNQTNTGTRSEIVLLITPRIVRAMAAPPAYVVEFPSGTSDNTSLRPMRLTPGAQYSGSDAQLAQQVPGLVLAAAGLPGASPGAAKSAAPAIAVIDLGFPLQVALDAEFALTVRYEPLFESIEFDLVADQAGVALVRTSQDPAGSPVRAVQTGQIIHVVGGKRSAPGEAVAVLTLKASAKPKSPVSFSVQNVRITGNNGVPLPVAVGLPRQLTVTP